VEVRPLLVTTLAGPEAPVHVAVSPVGVVRVQVGGDLDGFRASLPEHAPATAAAMQRWSAIRDHIAAAIAGDPVDLARIPLDLSGRSAWDAAVLRAGQGLGWGETASYGEIARRAGSPRAARAAGSAIRRCDLDVVVPCHRVIAADGTLGGYGGERDGPAEREGALERKRALLLREGRTVPRRRR
jgi:O-6-methylguanine DNA methyltransferase